MTQSKRLSPNTSNVLSVIMGGGQGSRLFPLTKERSKPAVPLAGKYRLVDIPISNCINSNLRRIYLLTQFNSASLHRHISQSYKCDQLYRMDFRKIINLHSESNADITIATLPVSRQEASSLGIMQMDSDRRIT